MKRKTIIYYFNFFNNFSNSRIKTKNQTLFNEKKIYYILIYITFI